MEETDNKYEEKTDICTDSINDKEDKTEISESDECYNEFDDYYDEDDCLADMYLAMTSGDAF